MYGANVIPTDDYAARTWQNAMGAEAAVGFGTLDSAGSRTTQRAAAHRGRPILDVSEGVEPSDVVLWARQNRFRSLNVTGNRESTNPGIGEKAEQFLLAVFRKPAGPPVRG